MTHGLHVYVDLLVHDAVGFYALSLPFRWRVPPVCLPQLYCYFAPVPFPSRDSLSPPVLRLGIVCLQWDWLPEFLGGPALSLPLPTGCFPSLRTGGGRLLHLAPRCCPATIVDYRAYTLFDLVFSRRLPGPSCFLVLGPHGSVPLLLVHFVSPFSVHCFPIKTRRRETSSSRSLILSACYGTGIFSVHLYALISPLFWGSGLEVASKIFRPLLSKIPRDSTRRAASKTCLGPLVLSLCS